MNEIPIFCTVFDKNYLYQGLAVYRSLERHCPQFKLYCLAMDEVCAETLLKLKLKSMVVVRTSDLNQDQLRELRPLVSYGQFCWSMQPLICRYVLDQNESNVTYIEADALFFSDPAPLFQEIGSRSISLAPHWYSPAFQKFEKESGTYCTHFNYFKNNAEGRECIEFWRTQCFLYRADKPYYLIGQLCLNEWPAKFPDVAIFKNRGAGVAPWNIQQYEITEKNGTPFVDGQKVVFYHFHQVSRYPNGTYELGTYPLSDEAIRLFYVPYLHAMQTSEREVAQVDASFHFFKVATPPPSIFKGLSSFKVSELKKALRPFKRRLTGTYNVFPLSKLMKS